MSTPQTGARLTWALLAVSTSIALIAAMTGIFLPVLLRARGLPITQLSWLLAMSSVVGLASTLPAGYLCDRLPAWALAPSALIGIAAAYWILAIGRTVESLVGSMVLLSLSATVFDVVLQSSLAQAVPRHSEGSYLGLQRAFDKGAESVGNLLGGFLYAASPSLPFQTAGGITLGAAVGTALITRHPAFVLSGRETEHRTLPSPGSRALAWSYPLVSGTALLLAAAFHAVRFIPLYAIEVARLSPAALGAFFSLLSVSYAISLPVLGRLLDRSKSPFSLLGIGYAGRLLFYAVLPLAIQSPWLWALVPVTLPYSMVLLAYRKALFYMTTVLPRGRLLSLERAGSLTAPLIALPIYGAVWTAWSPAAVFGVACAFLMASVPALYYMYGTALRHLRGTTRTVPREAPGQ